MSDDEPLAGGLGNEGRVVRRHGTVRRPIGPWTPSVHLLLDHLRRTGFDGAPQVLAVESDTEVLEFVEGDVAIPPFPAWSAGEELLVSVATLQRRYHDAVAGFVPPADAIWGGGPAAAPFAGELVCHNDLCLENVVVRDGRAVAFIDFDHARPVHRLWDIAIALRHWVPLRDPVDVDAGRSGVDLAARFRLFTDAHGLDEHERARVLDALAAFLDAALVSVRQQAEAGHTGHRAQWDAGYEGANRRARTWIDAHRPTLLAR